jgi:hypothetical protein
MNSTDGYFDVTANRTKIVTVPDGYEVRLHKIGSSEDIFPDGLSTKDIKDLNNTLVVDLSTPGTIDLKGTLLSNGQPLLTMDGVDTEIDKKITALNLSGTYATKAALTTVETTANAAAPQSTTYTKTECDNKFSQTAWVNSQIDAKIAKQNIPTTYATITSLNAVKATADAAAPQSTTYTKTECDNKYAPKSTTYTKTEVDTSLSSKANSADVYTKTESDNKYATKTEVTTIKTTADAAAPQATTYTKTECNGKFALLTTAYTKAESDNKYAPKSTTYTKTEVDTSLSSKANSADVYTKTESDNKYATKTEVTTIKTTADAAAPQATTYTKTECNGKFALLTTAYTKAESDNKYALKTDQSITSTSDKVQICNTSQQVANASAVTVVNGGLIFQTDGKVFIGVNGAWVQLGVPIS